MYKPDEPSEPEINPPEAPLQITLTGWTAGQVERALIPMIIERFNRLIENKVAEAVDAGIEQRVRLAVAERVDAAVDAQIEAALKEGWIKTDEYGRPKGERATIKDLILESLNRRDSYDRNRRVEQIVKETVETSLRTELGNEVEQARAQVKAMLDDEIKGRLAKAIKEALGVGR